MKGYTKTVKEKDGYTVTVYRLEDEQPFPDRETTSFGEFALWQKTHSPSRGFLLTKKKGDDDAYYGHGQEKLLRSGRKIFPTTVYDAYVMLRGGRVTGNAFSRHDGINVLIAALIVDDRGLEALTTPGFVDGSKTDTVLLRCMNNAAVMKKILTGKITNRRDMVREYLRSGFNLKGVNYAAAEKVLDSLNNGVSLTDLREFTTDINAALELLAERNGSDRALFRDLVGDAVILDKRINPKWSRSRMEQEHAANIKVILEKELDAEDDTCIYGKTIEVEEGGYAFHTIGSPRRALLESKTMSNCVFYNYWEPTLSRHYAVFHMSGNGEELTLGCRITDRPGEGRAVAFDQVFAAHNLPASAEGGQAAFDFIDRHGNDILAMASPVNAATGKIPDNDPFADLPF